jgi:hypothetical protein
MMVTRILFLLLAMAGVAGAATLTGRQVRYAAGSLPDMKAGCVGRLDLRDAKGLFLSCGGTTVLWPYASIRIVRIIDPVEERRWLLTEGPYQPLTDSKLRRVYVMAETTFGASWMLLDFPSRFASKFVAAIIDIQSDLRR